MKLLEGLEGGGPEEEKEEDIAPPVAAVCLCVLVGQNREETRSELLVL